MNYCLRIVLMLAAALAVPCVQAQGIPVIDGANITQSIVNAGQQIQQMVQQYNQLQQQYQSITGNRGFGNLDTSSISSLLPSSAQSAASALQGSSLSSSASTILQQEESKYQNSTDLPAAQQQDAWNRAASLKAMQQDAFTGAQERLGAMTQLQQEIAQTQDPKAAQELQARIAAEQGTLAAEQNKIALLKQMSDNEDKLDYQRGVDAQNKVLNYSSTDAVPFQ